MWIYVLLGYLALINLRTRGVRGWDKRVARRNGRIVADGKQEEKKLRSRISEKKLLMFSAAGGRLGALAAMQQFRHKTIKGAFLWKFWLIVVVWIIFFVRLLSYVS